MDGLVAWEWGRGGGGGGTVNGAWGGGGALKERDQGVVVLPTENQSLEVGLCGWTGSEWGGGDAGGREGDG